MMYRWCFTVGSLCCVIRNGGDAGADESGHAAGGAARLLRTPPAQIPQVQERHFPQHPRLQTRETRLGLLRTPGVRHTARASAHSVALVQM